jgi:hypothetical protein
MKTKPITLPIDPKKTYVAEFRYGLCAVPITVIGYEYVAGGFEKGWALIAEVAPDEQPKERDWSGVVKKLMHYAHRHCNSFRYHDSNGLYDLAEFKEDALAILQEFDRPSQPATQAQPSIQKKNDENVTIGHNPTDKESPAVETPFVVGELYLITEGRNVCEARLLAFLSKNDVYAFTFDEGKHVFLYPSHQISMRRTPSPAEHIYTTEEIKEELKYGVCADLYHKDEPTAVRIYKRAEIICQLLKELGKSK